MTHTGLAHFAMAAQQPETDSIIGLIGSESDLQRKAALLRPLNTNLIIIGLIGLAVTSLREASGISIAGVVLNLLLYFFVFFLERRQRTLLATYIFCFGVNFGVVFLVAINLRHMEGIESAIMFCYVLSLGVMISGMLIGVIAGFILAVADSLIIASLLFYYYYSVAQVGDVGDALYKVVGMAFPISCFLIIVAMISWLYQRSLAQASVRLDAARRRIMRDEILRHDLAVARDLQLRLYPPPPITNAAIRIASRSEPARETSGDFYDFIAIDDDRLGIVVADVTGKSIAAALVMAMTRSTLRSEATRHQGPADVLRYANQTLCQDNTFKQMITAFYGVLDTRTLRLAISNAGHPFPVIRRDGQITELEICGLPLGARPDAVYTEQIIQLQPGDQLVLVSDGLLEERNSRRELFGFERMLAAIAHADPLDPKRALDEIWAAVAKFRGDVEQRDDATLVIVQMAQDAAVGALSEG
ncbi:MAG: PP2C family protein-serine/threonine phosphatase [Chloroflexales bacterium]